MSGCCITTSPAGIKGTHFVKTSSLLVSGLISFADSYKISLADSRTTSYFAVARDGSLHHSSTAGCSPHWARQWYVVGCCKVNVHFTILVFLQWWPRTLKETFTVVYLKFQMWVLFATTIAMHAYDCSVQCEPCRITMHGQLITINKGEQWTDPQNPCLVYMCLVSKLNCRKHAEMRKTLYRVKTKSSGLYNPVQSLRTAMMPKLLTTSQVYAAHPVVR